MTEQSLLSELTLLNPWWQTGKVPAELALPFKREKFQTLVSYLSLERIIILKGSRRTGKSTIFYQMIAELINQGVGAQNLLLVSLDALLTTVTLDEIFSAWELLVKKTLKDMGPVYVFLDEASYLPSWPLMIKKYYDRKYAMRFLVSSSSSSLFEKETESLAGRTIEETLLPFSLSEMFSYEYQIRLPRIKGGFNRIALADFIPHKDRLKVTLAKYLGKGGFPHILTIEEKSLWQKLLREDVVDKAIYKDIVQSYKIKKPEVLASVFSYAQNTTAGIVNVSQAASDAGLSREYTERYLFYLERAYLLFRLSKFSRSPKEILRSNKKIHLIDPGTIGLNPTVSEDAVLESTVAAHLFRRFAHNLFYFRDSYEIDLIFKENGQLVPCEVKNSANTLSAEKNVLPFLQKYNSDYGLIVYRGEYQKKQIQGKTIFCYPVWLFLGAV